MMLRPLHAIQDVWRRFSESDGRPLHLRWWHAPPLALTGTSEAELLDRVSGWDGLVARHGRPAVVRFAEDSVWPALDALSPTAAVATARGQLALHALEATARLGHSEPALGWAERVRSVVAGPRLDADPARDRERKRALRKRAAASLREAAGALHARGQEGPARSAYALLDRLGELASADRGVYLRLLWTARDASPAALVAYLKYLEAPGRDPDPEGVRDFVLSRVTIDEHTPHEIVRDRLLFNQALLVGGAPGAQAALHVGLGHLRLDRPERAVDVLRLAQERDDAGGVASFHLGQALFHLERFAEAADAFQRATDARYSRSRILGWQALAYARARQWDRAFEILHDAEAVLPADELTSELYVCWGRASFLGQVVDDAASRFRRALELDVADGRAVVGLAICLTARDRTDEAIDVLQTWMGQNGHQRSMGAPAYTLGRLFRDRGLLKDAAAQFRVACEVQPEDAQYALALGVTLDDLRDREALPSLEQAAERGAGGAEVIRRLALGHLHAGDRKRARHWIGRLVEVAPGEAATALRERDVVTQADDAFNGGDYAASVRLLESVRGVMAAQEPVRERLALALTFAAARQLRAGSAGTEVWELVERAHGLARTVETEFFAAFSALVHGRFAEARSAFSALAERDADRPSHRFFEALSALLAGDADAAERLASLGPAAVAPDIEPVLAFFQAQIAFAGGDYRLAADKFVAWAENVEAVTRLDLPRTQANEFAAICLRLGHRRPGRVPGVLLKLSERMGNGYWDLAAVLVKHYDLVARGAAGATPTELAECDAAYQAMLSGASAAERPDVAAHYAAWLEFLVLAHLERHDIGAVLEVLAALDRLGVPPSPALRALRERLDARLGTPSPEAAFAVLGRDPGRAEAIWTELLARDAEDLETRHHLACLHWSRAFDEVQAGRFEGSLPSWRDGLEHYRQLYARDAYWQGLLQKGRKIRQPGADLDEAAFAAWRAEAPRQLLTTLLELIHFVLAEAMNEGDAATRLAARVMEIIRGSRVDDALKHWASDELARRRLDPDPTNLPDYDTSRQRAEQVIDIDTANLRARRFLLRAAAHTVHDRYAQGDRAFASLLSVLQGVATHADWLERRLDDAGVPRHDVAQDLCGYFDEVADVNDDQGVAEIGPINGLLAKVNQASLPAGLRRPVLQELRQRLSLLHRVWDASDGACRRSLAVEPANFKASEIISRHQKQRLATDKLLRQANEALT